MKKFFSKKIATQKIKKIIFAIFLIFAIKNLFLQFLTSEKHIFGQFDVFFDKESFLIRSNVPSVTPPQKSYFSKFCNFGLFCSILEKYDFWGGVREKTIGPMKKVSTAKTAPNCPKIWFWGVRNCKNKFLPQCCVNSVKTVFSAICG